MYDRTELLAQIATMYYENDFTQSQIAKKLHISRQTISNMLQEAKEKGIVKIIIQHPESNRYTQQYAIAKKFDLKSVHIASTQLNDQDTKKQIGRLCSEFLENQLDNISKLGIGWGTTVFEYVQQASYLNTNNLEIIPLIGGIGINDVQFHSNHLAFQLAEKYSANANYFYAPAIAESVDVKNLFVSTELFKQIYSKARKVDIAVVGVGNPIASSTYRNLGYISDSEMKEIQASKASGDILGSFFDQEGIPINTSFTSRMIGLTIEDLEDIPEIVALASGKEKIKSIKALLKLRLVNHLVIDQVIADAII